MEGPLTDQKATEGTYQFRSNGGEEYDRQGNIAAYQCPEGATITDLEATVGTYQHFYLIISFEVI